MKRICTILLLATVARAADVTLRMTGQAVVPNPVLWTAIERATRIYSAIGVSLEWTTRTSERHEDGVTIYVRFTRDTPGHPGAMAFAKPFAPAPAATVMYDRILFATLDAPEARAALLAYVMAHEIGHLLMRTDGHSPKGLMKAQWSPDDCSRMANRSLAFVPDDVDMIRRGLSFNLATR